MKVYKRNSGMDYLGEVQTSDIEDAAVTEPKLANASVATAKIQPNAVDASKIADAAVTNAKLHADVKVGSLASLNTSVKTDVVSAINEVNTKAIALEQYSARVYDDLTNAFTLNLDDTGSEIPFQKIESHSYNVTITDSPTTFTVTQKGLYQITANVLVQNSSSFEFFTYLWYGLNGTYAKDHWIDHQWMQKGPFPTNPAECYLHGNRDLILDVDDEITFKLFTSDTTPRACEISGSASMHLLHKIA